MLLFWLHAKAKRLDVNKWPVGGARLTTIGNIVYGTTASHVSTTLLVDQSPRLPVRLPSELLLIFEITCEPRSMGAVNLIVIVESVKSLIEAQSDKKFHLPSIIAVGAALGAVLVHSPSLQTLLIFLDQASNFYCSCIVALCAPSLVKWKYSGKTIETIFGSTDLVRHFGMPREFVLTLSNK